MPEFLYKVTISSEGNWDEYILKVDEEVAKRVEESLEKLVESGKFDFTQVEEVGVNPMSLEYFLQYFHEAYEFSLSGIKHGPKDWRPK